MSEFRQDLISGDWVIVAPGRAKRPNALFEKKKPRKPTPKSKCPFEDLKKTGNWPPVVAVPSDAKWRVIVIPNKYPALRHGEACALPISVGPYRAYEGVGAHELLVTRDHRNTIADLSVREGLELFRVLQSRYRLHEEDPCMKYVASFFNWGPTAGASVYHPHYQLLALPIIPPHVKSSLFGSERFWKKHHRCGHCETIRFERRYKKRVVAETGTAIALCPYAPQEPFEVRIFPKRHLPYFENTSERDTTGVVEILGDVLRTMRTRLNDPDLNFFIHTSPVRNRERYGHYHWHIEILPRLSISGGFELGGNIEITVVDPDEAATILRKR